MRKEIASKSALGKVIANTINKGNLVPDKLVLEITKKAAYGKKRILFDGIPRTLNQAKLIDQEFKIDKVFYLSVPKTVLIKRLANRMMCKCGSTYHLINKKPKKKGICDICGSKLFVREDDKPEVVRKRLEVNKRAIKTILDYYKKKGILIRINGNDTIENVYKNIISYLK